MFEDITYELILQRMLDRIPDNMDKREGSVIFNALAPAAVELQEMYISLDSILREAFADTASRDFLIRRAAEFGVYPDEPTYAVLKGEFNLEVPIGSRFSLDKYNYTVTEKISHTSYKLVCETIGSEPNQSLGTLIPIDYIEGLTNAQLTELLIPGQDEESVESLRKKFFEEKSTPVTSGNAAHYKKWATEVTGVGDAKIFPLKDGPSTVVIVIIDSDKRAASSELINNVQGYIENECPIGAIIKVRTVTEKPINISAKVKLAPGYSIQLVQNKFIALIDEYFRDIALKETYVSISKVGAFFLDTDGVIDYSDLSLNNGSANISIGEEEIAVLGNLTLEVS